MIRNGDKNSILFKHNPGEEWYQSVKQLVDEVDLEIEPSENSSDETCVQDHEPLTAYVQDEVIVAIDDGNVIGMVSYQSGLPNGGIDELDNYSPCVYLSQIVVSDEYRRSGLLDDLLTYLSDRISTRYNYFITRVWSGNRIRLHDIVTIDFSVELELSNRDDNIKAYYYVYKIK